MSVNDRRSALRMKRDEVQWNWLTVRRTLVIHAMLQKVVEKQARFIRDWPSARWTAYDCIWECSANTRHCIVVELVVVLGCGVPVCDIRLVPHLEVPGADLILTISLYEVFRVLSYQLPPYR